MHSKDTGVSMPTDTDPISNSFKRAVHLICSIVPCLSTDLAHAALYYRSTPTVP